MNLCTHCGGLIEKVSDLWRHNTERIAHQQVQFHIHGRITLDLPPKACAKPAEPIDFTK